MSPSGHCLPQAPSQSVWFGLKANSQGPRGGKIGFERGERDPEASFSIKQAFTKQPFDELSVNESAIWIEFPVPRGSAVKAGNPDWRPLGACSCSPRLGTQAPSTPGDQPCWSPLQSRLSHQTQGASSAVWGGLADLEYGSRLTAPTPSHGGCASGRCSAGLGRFLHCGSCLCPVSRRIPGRWPMLAFIWFSWPSSGAVSSLCEGGRPTHAPNSRDGPSDPSVPTLSLP